MKLLPSLATQALVNQTFLAVISLVIMAAMTRKADESKGTALDPSGIERRLDAIIHVLLRQTEVQEMNTRGRIALLKEIGLKDSEIAGILGRTRSYVASELSVLRRESHGK